jgi:hypothetical protein
MKYLKRFESWENFPQSEIIGAALSLLSGVMIVAPWLTSIYFDWRNQNLEKRAEEILKKKSVLIRKKIGNFISKISPQISDLRTQLELFEGEDNPELKKQLIREFRDRVFTLLKREDNETQSGVLDILKEIEPKIKEYFRIENI